MAIVTTLARGIGSGAGWLAASAVHIGASAIDQLGEAGPAMAEGYETAYEARSTVLDMSPEERKAIRAAKLQAKREALSAKAPAAKKKLVAA